MNKWAYVGLWIGMVFWCISIQYQMIALHKFIEAQTRFDHAIIAGLLGDKN